MKKNLAILLSALTVFTSCYYDNVEELYPKNPLDSKVCDTTAAVSYSKDIRPILDQRCGVSSCHSPSSAVGVDLTSFAVLSSLAAINPADGSSKLYSVVSWDGKASQSKMPSGSTSKIDDCSIAKIRLWVKAGAPNN